MNRELIHDRTVKLLVVPVLGIVLPNITGLITNNRYSFTELLLCYAYFILISLTVWQGNVWIMYFIRKKYEWRYNQYYKIILSLFLANVVYSGSISALLLNLWVAFS